MSNQKPKTTTIVKMDRNSAAGQWWLNQSDREFSMEILTKLANKLYGNNKDLKEVALNRVMSRLDSDITPEIKAVPAKESDTIDTNTQQNKTVEKPQENTLKQDINHGQSETKKTNDNVSDALFDNKPVKPTTNKPTSSKNFRNLM